MIEIWKEYPLDKKLLVSNFGNVKRKEILVFSKRTKPYLMKEKTLKQSLTGKGYKKQNGYLVVKSLNKHYKVHRLVAITFIENKENLNQVNHKDKNTTNNYFKNLEWCTNIQNSHHSKQDRKNYSSGFIGVRYRKDRKNYSAELKYNGTRYRKSGFKTQEEANEYLTKIKKELCL